jgi:hypothetical protein
MQTAKKREIRQERLDTVHRATNAALSTQLVFDRFHFEVSSIGRQRNHYPRVGLESFVAN